MFLKSRQMAKMFYALSRWHTTCCPEYVFDDFILSLLVKKVADTDSSRDWKRFPSLKPVTVYNINLVLLTISTHQLYCVSVNNNPHSRWRIPLTTSLFSTLISPQNLLKALWLRVLLNCIICIFCKWPIYLLRGHLVWITNESKRRREYIHFFIQKFILSLSDN